MIAQNTALFRLRPAKHQTEDAMTLLLSADPDAWSQWLQHCDEKYGTVEEEWARVMGNAPMAVQADILKAKAQPRVVGNLLDIIHRFEGVKPSGGHEKWMAFCQAHQDGQTQGRRSLSLRIKDGKILVNCFAGCRTLDAVMAAGLTMSDLFEGDGNIEPASASGATVEEIWPAPLSIPDTIPAAPVLAPEMLPSSLREWILDIAHRMQCPPDYPASAAVVGLGAVIGKRVQIAPKQRDTWKVVPNLWGFAEGHPGEMKSPAVKAAFAPLFKIAQEERDKAAQEQISFDKTQAQVKKLKERIKQTRGTARVALEAELDTIETLAPEKPPITRRLLTNDATIEKLGILLNENPNGLLIEREELTGLFHSMEQEGHQQDRSFYLEAWDGHGSKAIDRVARGSLWVPSCVLSIHGTIQPQPLATYLRQYYTEGQADGFIERFQIAVYPEPRPWSYVDEAPNLEAIDRAAAVYRYLHALREESVLRFSEEAQELFRDWWGWLERTLAKNSQVHPLLRSHFSKYRALMPALALIFQLVNSPRVTEVKLPAARMAAAWCDYLAGHAQRVYWPIVKPGGSAMDLLADRLPALAGRRLTVRDFEHKNWTGLRSNTAIEAGLQRLAPLHWVRPEPAGRWGTGTRWAINPSLESLEALAGKEDHGLSILPSFLS